MASATSETQRKVEAARSMDQAVEQSWQETIQQKTADLTHDAKQQAERISAAATEAIRRQPAQALMVAAALGGLAGIIFKRR